MQGSFIYSEDIVRVLQCAQCWMACLAPCGGSSSSSEARCCFWNNQNLKLLAINSTEINELRAVPRNLLDERRRH